MTDTHGGGRNACPSLETLAAYLDGTLPDGARASVEAHIADCDECREVAAESFLACDDAGARGDTSRARPAAPDEADGQVRHGTGRTARPPAPVIALAAHARKRRWPLLVGVAAAAVVVLGVVVPRLMKPADPSARPGLEALVAAVGEHRPFEPRLTGGFKYGPLAPVMRSGEAREPDASPEVQIAAAELTRAAEGRRDAQRLADRASGELVVGHTDAAIALLQRACEADPGRAAFWSDLAAARLVRALQSGRSVDSRLALAAADRALERGPRLPEALFNRALALTAAGLHADASEGWTAYLAADPSSPWSAVARGYQRGLQAR